MNLRDIMSTPVFTLSPGQPASDALAWMKDAGVRHAVVVSGTTILGVVSERDLGGRYGGAARKGRVVSDFMSPDLVPGSPDTSLRQAALIMRTLRLGCLPVLSKGVLVGIVTRSDLLGALAAGRRSLRIVLGRRRAPVRRRPPVSSPMPEKRP